jgi:hypothetical protein
MVDRQTDIQTDRQTDRQIRSLPLVDQPHRLSFIDTGSPVYFENEWDCNMLPYSTF